MPVTYRFDSKIVVIEMVDEYSIDDLHAAVLNSLADSECPVKPSILFNLTESRSIHTRSSEEVKASAISLASLGKHFSNRIALVASTDLAYGLMRMGSVFAEEEGAKPQVFRTFVEAWKWLSS